MAAPNGIEIAVAAGRLEDSEDEEIRESSTQLAVMCTRKRKPRAKTISEGSWEKALKQAREMIASGEWDDALPRHYVAAYALLHEKVYGVAPAELTAAARLRAAGLVAGCLDRQFGGDKAEMAAMMRWTWQREVAREKWRRENDRSGGRIGVHLQFGACVSDYRVDKARRSAR